MPAGQHLVEERAIGGLGPILDEGGELFVEVGSLRQSQLPVTVGLLQAVDDRLQTIDLGRRAASAASA